MTLGLTWTLTKKCAWGLFLSKVACSFTPISGFMLLYSVLELRMSHTLFPFWTFSHTHTFHFLSCCRRTLDWRKEGNYDLFSICCDSFSLIFTWFISSFDWRWLSHFVFRVPSLFIYPCEYWGSESMRVIHIQITARYTTQTFIMCKNSFQYEVFASDISHWSW